MKFIKLFCVVFAMQSTLVFAEQHHASMDHSMHHIGGSNAILTEAGNDVFGTIQEVIKKLNADPSTDWTKVDLEALRQHLLDMRDMAENVEVVSQTPIEKGLQIVIHPTTPRAMAALGRAFKMHPAQLKREAGWDMGVEKKEDGYTLTVTTENPDEVSKIRGLGYIGIMAYGSHHQPHHWAIATGQTPH